MEFIVTKESIIYVRIYYYLQLYCVMDKTVKVFSLQICQVVIQSTAICECQIVWT